MPEHSYLTALHEQLVPTREERAELQASVDRVVQATRRSLPLAEVRPAGSWAKSTMLRGRQEADIVAVLAQAPTDATLGELARDLDDLPGIRRRPQVRTKALNLVFGSGVSIDLLPTVRAGRTPPGPSTPPKLRHANDGIQHVQWLIGRAHGTVTHPVIRLAKHLRDCHRHDFHGLSSFAIEVLCVELGLSGSLDHAFRDFLEHLALGWLDRRPLPDPANPSNDLIAGLSARGRKDIAGRAERCLRAVDADTWSAVFPRDAAALAPPAGNIGGRTLG